MGRYAILNEFGQVVNIVVATPDVASTNGWVEAVGEYATIYSPVVIPQSLPVLDAMVALDAEGLSGAYEQWASSPSRTFVQKAFINHATHWLRTDPTLITAASDLGLTNEQVDQLFIKYGK